MRKTTSDLTIVAEVMEVPCPDCQVGPGEKHQKGCDVERCSICKGQRLMCGCKGHQKKKSIWTGEWPGVAECRERGWFHKSGSSVPCSPDAPNAEPDLNRLAGFHATGKDEYDL